MPLLVKDAAGTTKRVPTPNGDPIYFYAGSALAPVATPTAIIVIKAHATKVRRVRRIRASGAATAAGSMPITVNKRTTNSTPDTAVLTDVVPGRCQNETGAPETGGVGTVGTANYQTLGTLQGMIGAGRLNFTALGTGVGVTPFAWQPSMPIALTPGSTEEVTVDLAGAALPAGGVVDWEVETEESDPTA